jgi:Thioredoxin like C-terminal domain
VSTYETALPPVAARDQARTLFGQTMGSSLSRRACSLAATQGIRAAPLLASLDLPRGFEAQADWQTLGSSETYLGYAQGQNFVSANTVEFDEPQGFGVTGRLERNQSALSGNWTLEPGKASRSASELLAQAYDSAAVGLDS